MIRRLGSPGIHGIGSIALADFGLAHPGGAVPWWLSGGILAADCIAAYQPKGAASYAASKVNLANPGTYNAVDGAAFPSWNMATGWTFLAASSQYLDSTVLHNDAGQNWSMIVQYANAVISGTGDMVQDRNAINQAFGLLPRYAAASRRYCNSGVGAVAASSAAGNMCIAGPNGYWNGAWEVAIGVSAQISRNIFIGAGNAVAAANFWSGDILAMAVYTVTITAAQVLAVATAMAAL